MFEILDRNKSKAMILQDLIDSNNAYLANMEIRIAELQEDLELSIEEGDDESVREGIMNQVELIRNETRYRQVTIEEATQAIVEEVIEAHDNYIPSYNITYVAHNGFLIGDMFNSQDQVVNIV